MKSRTRGPYAVMSSLNVNHEKIRVARSSVFAALFVTGLKLVVGLETNSLGILSEAAHSGLDMLAAILTLVAVTIADRPPDKEHMYGHGKVENISAFVETLLLVATCGWIIWEAVERLLTKSTHVEATVWSFGVIIFSIFVDIGRSRALSRAAKKYRSQALEADALHFSSDIWSSLVVLAGLVFVSLGHPTFDAIAALVVAILVLVVSYRLGKRTIQALIDRVPEGLYEEIDDLVRGINGVADVKALRVRMSGSRLFVDTTVYIPRTMLFHQAHEVMDRIEQAVREKHPDVDVMVHAEPFERKDETIAERIRMIILEKGLGAPHNLEVHRSDDRYHIVFDLEFTKGKKFEDAHDLATQIEKDIRSKIPQVKNVTIHMEEELTETREAREETKRETLLRKKIGEAISADRRILGFRDVQLLKIGDKYNLSVTCNFETSKTLGEIHQIVTEMESRLYDRFKELRRVTVHAEPGGS